MYILLTRRVSYNKQELLTLREHLGSPSVVGGVRAHLYIFCVKLFIVVFVLCLVYQMVLVSLDCSIVIVSSVLSQAYLILSILCFK
jgi:hypothetical protein